MHMNPDNSKNRAETEAAMTSFSLSDDHLGELVLLLDAHLSNCRTECAYWQRREPGSEEHVERQNRLRKAKELSGIILSTAWGARSAAV